MLFNVFKDLCPSTIFGVDDADHGGRHRAALDIRMLESESLPTTHHDKKRNGFTCIHRLLCSLESRAVIQVHVSMEVVADPQLLRQRCMTML